MRTLDVSVPSFNTTLVGMLRGVAGSFGLSVSDAMLFGGSGHAFMMHVHESLCPSGPYCFERTPLFKQICSLGIEVEDLGFFHQGSSLSDRNRAESLLLSEIESGRPAGLVNMEFQLITGYDEEGFLTSQPWPCSDFPPKHLNFGSWSELGDEIHLMFFTFRPIEPSTKEAVVRSALMYAVDLYDHPEHHQRPGYGVGEIAYRNWIAAIPEHGASHGNWWNASVWSECRQFASKFLNESSDILGEDISRALSQKYLELSNLLCQVSEKDSSLDSKAERLTSAAQLELEAIRMIKSIL